MKTVIIAGAGSNVGKTTVLRSLKTFFPNNISVKLGKTEVPDKSKKELLLPSNYSLEQIRDAVGQKPEYLLIEGNSILKTYEPDLAIFVDGEPENRREDAQELKEKCHLVVGGRIECRQAFILAKKINLDRLKFGELLNSIKVKLKDCQLGCF
jgi:hypothetical protein